MTHRARTFGRRLSSRHGTVVAYLALVLASSGVAYAAATVGTADVVNNSLKSIDLKDGYGVGGVDVINDSLTGADIQEGTLVGVDAATLDGVQVADLIQGTGKASAAWVFVPQGTSATIFTQEETGVVAEYRCPMDLADPGYFFVTHDQYMRVFVDRGGPNQPWESGNPNFVEVGPGSDTGGSYMDANADNATLQVALSSGGFVTTFEVYSRHLGSSSVCYVQGQAVFTALP